MSHRSTQRRINPLEPPIINKYPKEGLLRIGLDNARDTYLIVFLHNDNDDGRDTESAFFGCVYVIFRLITFYHLSIFRLHGTRMERLSMAEGACDTADRSA